MTTAAVKILLVEDSPSDADVLQETLQQAGLDRFELTWVERLDDALARLSQEAFDVLLLDLSLPDSTGAETFQRARRAAPEMPIVVLTGASDETIGLEAVRYGVQDYLVKGQTDRRQIARTIRYAIERQGAETALRQARDELERRVLERTAALANANAVLQAEIAERTEAQRAVSQLSHRLLQLKDEEQRHLARELHDSTAQLLAGLAINLAIVRGSEKRLSATPRKALAESMALADQCSREIRTLSYLLHPPLLDEVGLGSAVRWYADGFAERSGIRTEVHVPPDLERLSQAIETALFRILQECVSNVHRHSGSPTVSIRITRAPAAITLEVKDCGRGMVHALDDKTETYAGLGVGIAGMRERVRQLGGELQIQSNGGGTTVKATLPLTQTEHVE